MLNRMQRNLRPAYLPAQLFPMKKMLWSVITLLPIAIPAPAQFTLSGSVKDKNTNEPLSFAAVGIAGSYIGVLSTAEGAYTIRNLKPGTYVLQTSLLGYKRGKDSITISGDMSYDVLLEPAVKVMDEVIVSSTRAGERSGIAHSDLSKEEIEKQNFGQDVPYLLNQLPSVVVTSDAGAGVGYTGIRIRGSDATRVNVTINGVPVNDAESQGTFWVDMPDLLSSTDNIQVQRGIGTSTNGAGAFGGTINLQTSQLNEKAYAELRNGYGSFNTRRHTLSAGTGLLNEHWVFDLRLSEIASDGYIDRATSFLRSYFLSGGYYGAKTTVKALMFSGYERTYQAWNGVPQSYEDTNRTYNSAGLHTDARGLVSFYENETDNYWQDNYQLHWSQRLGEKWRLNTALHYTYGRGYYEQYRDDELLYDYNIGAAVIGADTITTSDLIRRRWLDNDFYGMTWSLNYNGNKKLTMSFGGAANNYEGRHFGRVIWAQFAGDSNYDWEYYRNDAEKRDVNVYAKASYALNRQLSLFGDLQLRSVNYEFLGYDQDFNNVQQEANMSFFNPKAGLHFAISDKQSAYASFALANKEPNRDDFTQSSPLSRPRPETLYDYEAGWKLRAGKVRAGVNFYYMQYKNQLVLTGEINDVGAYNRTNVEDSYRAGVEIEAGWQPAKQVSLSANATLSRNRIKNFKEFIDDYDNGGQLVNSYAETDIAFSPSAIGAAQLSYRPLKGLELALLAKYVGRQYLDNTRNGRRALDPYFTSDARISYSLKLKKLREIGLAVLANNFTNTLYSSNGYTFSYQFGGELVTENYVYPQAGANFMTMLTLKF